MSKNINKPIQVRKNLAPITPLRISKLESSRSPSPANWNKWQFIPKCQIWEAVCLTLDIEPDKKRHDIQNWLKHRRNVPYGLPAEFSYRLEIALANVSTKGRIHPPLYQGALHNPKAEVMLSEVVSAAIVWGWSLPDPMRSIIKANIKSSLANDTLNEIEKTIVKHAQRKHRVLDLVLPYLQEVYKSKNLKNTTEFIRLLKKKSTETASPFKTADISDDALFLRDGGKSLSCRTIGDNMKLIRN